MNPDQQAADDAYNAAINAAADDAYNAAIDAANAAK